MGNASRIHDNARHLAADDEWEVTVLAPPPTFPFGSFERSWERSRTYERDGMTVHRLWAWQPTTEDPGLASRLLYYVLFPLHALLWLTINYRSFDVIFLSSPPVFVGIAGLPFALLDRKPLVVDVRDLWIDSAIELDFIEEGGLFERFSRAYERVLLEAADRITVTTALLGSRLAATYGIDEEKIHHIPNGVDVDRYTPTETETEGTKTIVYTGNVGHAQDLESCIRAVGRLERSDVVFRIVGDGDRAPALKRLVAEEGLEDVVEFEGLVPREAVPGYIEDAEVGLAPIKSDEALEYAVPTKTFEYLACKVPVVATGSGEIESVIESSGGGVVVDNDPDAIATVLDRYLDDPQRRERLGERGRRHIEAHYDRAATARRLGTVLEDACGGGSGTSSPRGRPATTEAE
ncbi:glycosyltransferase family 4 protein [Natrinema amylolyticum]|uniref:glycosyltransferase family 4 protein n=1 Tax=Natrinema amylolyticum TaxID=2878679 RepID=UPI001CFA66FC|nr:glycosyltransferase family 4 protein [Natrinema amylolyticum]